MGAGPEAPTTAEWWDELNCAEMKAAVMGKTPAPVDTNTDGMGYCNLYGGLDSARQTVVTAIWTPPRATPKWVSAGSIIDQGTAAGSNSGWF